MADDIGELKLLTLTEPALRGEAVAGRVSSPHNAPVAEAGFALRSRVSGTAYRMAARKLIALGNSASRSVSASIMEERRFGHGFLFAPVMIGLGCALWFCFPNDLPPWPWLGAVIAASSSVALVLKGSPLRLALIVFSLILGGMMLAQAETWRRSTVILDSAVTTDVVGVVERSEMAAGGRTRYVLSLQSTANPQLRRPPGQISVIARSRHEPFENGAVIAGRARLSPPSGPALPGLHDFAFSAYFDGIGAVGYFYRAPQRVAELEVARGWRHAAQRWLFDLRARIGNRIRTTAPGDAGAFAAAIVTDERRAISDETVEALRVSGLAHIVAISGLNMALAAGIFFVGLRTLLAAFPGFAQAVPVKKLAAAGALAMVTCYYLISGFGVSAQRAYIMMAVMLVAVLLDRPSISLRNVALSALIIIAWSPSEILGPSFQMSFAATAALVAGYGAWAGRARREQHEPLPFRHPMVTSTVAAWKFLAGIILTSLIGSLSTTMFSVEHFHRIATYGLAANLAAMPIISFMVMPAGLIAMLLMPLGFDGPFIAVMAEGLSWVIAIAKHVAGWGGDIEIGQPHPWFLPLGVTGFLLLTLLRSRLRLSAMPFLAAALVLFWFGFDRPATSLLASEDGTLVGVSVDGAIAINRTKPPDFLYDQWKRARRLPEPIKPALLADDRSETARIAPRERLPAEAVAAARRDMRKAGAGRFTCQSRAWCSMTSPDGVFIVVVEDGRYVGAACDVADLVIASRTRIDSCRSGAPLLNGATLRKIGSIEMNFSRSKDPAQWQVVSAMEKTSRPWSLHREYDWRSDTYSGALPSWLSKALGRSGQSTPATSHNARPERAHPLDAVARSTRLSDTGE
jgi:competence protein ComEC